MLISIKGLAAAGIFSHARLYYNLLITMCGTVGHNIRSISLDDARNPLAPFGTTHLAWTALQIAFGYAGITFAFFGQEIVDTITNGKLTEAAIYIPAFFVVALIQTAEQPAEAIVSVSKRTTSAAHFRIVASICVVVALYPSILYLGTMGLLALNILEVVAYRLFLHILASRERKVPSENGVLIICALAIALAQACAGWLEPTLSEKAFLTMAGFLLISIISRDAIHKVISQLWKIFESIRSV